jgi:two-component system, chemotaxis family, CheB/CheR fusion protein
MAYIVIQHLSPDYKSMMVELLSKRTDLAVERATDGQAVCADTLYLIPPKTNLQIFHGKLLLTEQGHNRGLNLPIDIFFRSLAEDQGERAVGVVLSGTGSDGMRGVRAIKEAGGMVMVQAAESAKFDGMPRSAISTGVADFILPADELAPRLLRYVKFPRAAREESAGKRAAEETDMDRLFALLRDHNKVDFTHYKPSTVQRRLERRMSINQMENLAEYVRFLDQNPRELTTLYRELLIGVTCFFRDPPAYAILKEKVFPDLFRAAEGRELRFWVAGCSTGEEAYSIAMLSDDVLGAMGSRAAFKIFATDVDQGAVAQAGNGVYPASLLADLPPGYQHRYFHAVGDSFHVDRALRERVVFAQHNLVQDPPFTSIDLISCRNLLIYLQPVLQSKALEFFNFSLNPGGILFLGSSESCGNQAELFQPLDHKWKIYRSRGRKAARHERVSIAARRGGMDGGGARLASPGRRTADSERDLERVLEAVAGQFGSLTLVVNEQLELLYLFGDGSGLLKIPQGRARYDVGKLMIKELAIPLVTSIQRSFSRNEDVAFSNIIYSDDGETKRVSLLVKLIPSKAGRDPMAVAFIQHEAGTGASAAKGSGAEAPYDYEEGMVQRVADLEQELQFTKENLQATIEELETSNEELQATNEELLASNEELQSTNEELQSVNEELHTVNAEHQQKIIELTEMTNDLNNLLDNIRHGALFLDENMAIRRFTKEIADVIQLRDADIGRPLDHLNHRLRDVDLVEQAGRVARSARAVEMEVANDEGVPFFMRIHPYEIGPDRYSGLVMIFTNIRTLRSAQRDLAVSERRLKLTARLAQVGSWEYIPATGEQRWSDEVYAIHDLPPGRQPTPEEGIAYYAAESRPIIQRVFQAAVQRGTPYDEVLEIVSAKGIRKWVRAIGNPVVKEGDVVRIDGAFMDVTRVTLAERAVGEQRESAL